MILIMIYMIYHNRWSISWSIWSITLDDLDHDLSDLSDCWLRTGLALRVTDVQLDGCLGVLWCALFCSVGNRAVTPRPSENLDVFGFVFVIVWCRCVMCLLLLVKNLDTSVSSLQFAVFDVSDVFVVFWTRHFGFVAVIVVALWKIATFSVASLSLLILVGSVFML